VWTLVKSPYNIGRKITDDHIWAAVKTIEKQDVFELTGLVILSKLILKRCAKKYSMNNDHAP